MPPDWLKIKDARPDVTDYLIHFTRRQDIDGENASAFEVLKRILSCGFLKASFAPRSIINGGVSYTIRGPHPAVCFTEQPLNAFVKSCLTLPSRYQMYGVAVRKDRLFGYGGRPVIYGDEYMLNGVADDYKYLWVRLQPDPEIEENGYPIDWTHEREWRARVKPYHYLELGNTPPDGIPLLLPPSPASASSSKPKLHLPWILVKRPEEVHALKQWINDLPSYNGQNGFLKHYFQNLDKAPMIALEEVENRLEQGNVSWSRIDTLPIEELDETVANNLDRVGWRNL